LLPLSPSRTEPETDTWTGAGAGIGEGAGVGAGECAGDGLGAGSPAEDSSVETDGPDGALVLPQANCVTTSTAMTADPHERTLMQVMGFLQTVIAT
jgi:hypothetical protein